MFHKKHYYTPSIFLNMPDYQGVHAIPVDLDREFLSESACLDFIEGNNLHAEQEQIILPMASAACNPECFCKIYRRHITLRRPRRSIRLIFAGYERMRRSVAEQALIDKGLPASRDIPKGYHLSAIWAFLRSFF